MKWVKEDYKGNKQVWYSADVIEKIKELCLKRPHQTIDKILKIIEEEECQLNI